MTIVICDQTFWPKKVWSNTQCLVLRRLWYFEDEFWNKTSVCVTLDVHVLHCLGHAWNNFVLFQKVYVYFHLVLTDWQVPQPYFYIMSHSRQRDESERYGLDFFLMFLFHLDLVF